MASEKSDEETISRKGERTVCQDKYELFFLNILIKILNVKRYLSH